MNKDFVLWNLEEACESINKIIAEMKNDPEYDYPEFSVDMEHLYNHINTSWNARDATKEQAQKCEDRDFKRWSQMPKDVLIMGEE